LVCGIDLAAREVMLPDPHAEGFVGFLDRSRTSRDWIRARKQEGGTGARMPDSHQPRRLWRSKPAERSSNVLKYALLMMVICALLLVVGCGKAPEQERQTAETAFETAAGAETQQYAPDAYAMALDTLNAAKAAMEQASSKFALFRSYGKSRELFVRAEALAKEAQVTAQDEKERVKEEVSVLIVQAKTALDVATEALAKAPRGKGSKADIELIKNDLNAASVAYEEAKIDFDAGKYAAAKTKLQAVTRKAQSISEEIAKAAAKKSGK
jgi:hypothetical protein